MTDPSQYFKGRTVQEQMTEVIGYVDTRAAEVATDAIASDVAQVHQDMLDADADASAAAASAAAAAGTLANAVKKTGESSQSIAGSIGIGTDLSVGQDADVDGALNVDGDSVLNGNLSVGGTGTFVGAVTVPAPVNNTDAATKKYVDDKDALDVHLAGSEAITGAKTVPLETTGTFSNQIASSNKVKNELDNYAPMIRTTGNQDMVGIKTIISQYGTNNLVMKGSTTDVTIGTFQANIPRISFVDKNDVIVVTLMSSVQATGSGQLQAYIRNADGTYKYVQLANGE